MKHMPMLRAITTEPFLIWQTHLTTAETADQVLRAETGAQVQQVEEVDRERAALWLVRVIM